MNHGSSSTGDRVAIVTGAGQGIGRGIAEKLAERGMGVVLVDLVPDGLEAAVAAIGAAGGAAAQVQGSVGERATADRAVALAVQRFGGVDVVVNCAHAYTPHASLDAIAEADFRTELDSGFFGTVHFMQAAFPAMCERGGGSIVNFGSQVALEGHANRATYAATKEAIRGLSRSAARDWGRHGIRVNVVCPMALTPAIEQRVAPEVLEQVIATTPLGYMGSPAGDVAPAVAFLASEESRYVTGQTLNVDGGRWMST
jgi:2-hydroxycyclohexanecarboxyl-CoA dehydrogenase